MFPTLAALVLLAAGPAPAPPELTAKDLGFSDLKVAISTPLSPTPAHTVRVVADATRTRCYCLFPGRPARGDRPAWSPWNVTHTPPPAQLRELGELLAGTGWLTRPANPVLRMHATRYEFTLVRDGKTTTLKFEGEPEGYEKLLHFARSLGEQEYLYYRLHVGGTEAFTEGLRALDNLVAAGLREPREQSLLRVDPNRFAPWARVRVRDPFDKPTAELRVAVRLVGLLKLDGDREFLLDLANDRERDVRTAVVGAVGRLGWAKSVPVLKRMVRTTGGEAAWELIKLGPDAVPVVASVIRREGVPAAVDYEPPADPGIEDDISFETVIRAYIEHWPEVKKPLDPRVLDAVRASMADPKVRAFRPGTPYQKELLNLAAGRVPASGGR